MLNRPPGNTENGRETAKLEGPVQGMTRGKGERCSIIQLAPGEGEMKFCKCSLGFFVHFFFLQQAHLKKSSLMECSSLAILARFFEDAQCKHFVLCSNLNGFPPCMLPPILVETGKRWRDGRWTKSVNDRGFTQ